MGKRIGSIGRPGAAVVAVGLALALPAGAGAGVPKQDYACYGETSTYIGTLKIKSATKYDYLGAGGKYKFKAGPKVLKFKTGPLKPWVGKLLKVGGDPVIKLVTDKAGGQAVDCY